MTYEDEFNYGIRYVYEGLEEHRPVLQEAWCSDCDKIVRICTPFTVEQAERSIANLNERINWKKEVPPIDKNKFRRIRVKLKKWINREKESSFAEILKLKNEEILKLEEEIQTVNARLEYFENTTYKSKCLFCGGDHIFPLNIDDYYVFKTFELNVNKHSCGGQLLIRMHGWKGFTDRSKVVFDETGRILRDERKQKT